MTTKKNIDVIVTVHVEEHVKFISDCHIGHSGFFKLLLDESCRIPMTLLISRVKETDKCPYMDADVLNEIAAIGTMEIGLHVHPALSKHSFDEQRRIIEQEYFLFYNSTGIIPKSFSGGHWCINTDTLKIANSLGLLVDASVVPGCTVISNNGAIVKYSKRISTPYWTSLDNLNRKSKHNIMLEVPVTTNHNGKIMDINMMSTSEILDSFEHIENTMDMPFLHMTFHSYDVMFPNGDKNYIYDKIAVICDRLNSYFSQVNYFTCYQYYKKMGGRIIL